MADNTMTFEALEARMTLAPYHKWLGLKLLALDEDGITVGVTWRPDFEVSPDRHYTHGGILATVIDIAGDYALAAKLGRPVPTVDLRVDYHRVAAPGDLTVKARIIKIGRIFSTAEAQVFDGEDKLLASGRAVYLSEPAG